MAPMPWTPTWTQRGHRLVLPLAGAFLALMAAFLLAPASGWRAGGRHFARPADQALVAPVLERLP